MNQSVAIFVLLTALLAWPLGESIPCYRLKHLSTESASRDKLSVHVGAWFRRSGSTSWLLLASFSAAVVAILVPWPIGLIISIGVIGSAWLGIRFTLAKRDSNLAVTAQLRLAAAWDLLAACLQSGMPMPLAIQALMGQFPWQVANTLHTAIDLLRLGAEPAKAWEAASQHPATATFARIARRAGQSGASLARSVSALATDIRTIVADTMEARANRAGVLIVGPLGLCFLPAFLCLGVGPVVLGLLRQLNVVT